MITKFNNFLNEKHIEQDYVNSKLSNEIKKDNDIKYINQGWFLYHKDILNIHAKKPPKEGWYNVRAYYGYDTISDYGYYKNGKFKKTKKYGLTDYDITHWKVKEIDDTEYNYDFNTGKFDKFDNFEDILPNERIY